MQKEIKLEKYQTIKNDIPGDVRYEVTVKEPDNIIQMTKYLSLSRQDVEKLIEVLQYAIK